MEGEGGERTSYRLGEGHVPSANTELARLEAQVVGSWEREAELFVRHGLRPDADVVEAGCGPGFVTERLLDLVPNGSVTAFDLDPRMVELASARVAGRARVGVARGSVTDTGLQDASADAVIARLVLQHVPNVDAALAELRRLLRAGGRLIVLDVDDGATLLVDPAPAFLRPLLEGFGAAQRARGGDRLLVRRLPGLMLEAGLSDLTVDAVVSHSAVHGLETLRRLLPVAAVTPAMEAGFIPREIGEAALDWVADLDAGRIEPQLLLTTFVVSGAVS